MARVKASKKRTLRDRLLAVAVAVTAAPFVFLVAMSRWEVDRAAQVAAADRLTLTQVTQRLRETSLAELHPSLRALAAEREQRIVIRSSSGKSIVDVDAPETSSWATRIGDLFYGPSAMGLATLAVDEQPAPGETTRFGLGTNVLIHTAVNRVETAADGQVWVSIQGFSRRAALPALLEARQLAKLLSASLCVAVVVAWVLSRWLIRPLEQLRTEVLARASEAVPQAGIDLGRRDEVGDVADAFNTLLTALAERNQNHERFLADLAHEMKNPVAAIRACAEVMAQGGLTADRVTRMTGVLQHSSTQLDTLITQFLELARAEAGLPQEQRERVDLSLLLRGLQSRWASELRFATVDWRCTGLDETQMVMGVPIRLERAFGNLLHNALSFAGDNGWVAISIAAVDSQVEVVISDSGPGISVEHLPRVFERFFTTRGEKGTGLGLALTRAMVEAHGGQISVSSPTGQGASFRVRLPAG